MERISSTLDDLQGQFENVTPAARISSCLKALVAEGNINPDEIIALIRLEPLLAARIMREANQSLDARESGYASIEEAATQLGFERMYDLLGLNAFQYSETQNSPAYSSERWKRSVTTAVCMESLAQKHHLDSHRAYSIGLLHSLAAAIDEACHPGDADAVAANPRHPLNNRLQNFCSSGLSYSLLREWSLPRSFIDPVRFQYSPLDCQTEGKMACLLNLAKWITGVIREVDELPNQAFGPDLLVLNLLGEGEQTLWNLVSEVSESLRRADDILQGKHSCC